ncbi:hypothetical protein C8J57DRAFT_1252843 [Mycena rebaudengoi]|nr:hypothetical protein C8J57DRAFT_1252843 [Mycena rebaudengoi]
MNHSGARQPLGAPCAWVSTSGESILSEQERGGRRVQKIAEQGAPTRVQPAWLLNRPTAGRGPRRRSSGARLAEPGILVGHNFELESTWGIGPRASPGVWGMFKPGAEKDGRTVRGTEKKSAQMVQFWMCRGAEASTIKTMPSEYGLYKTKARAEMAFDPEKRYKKDDSEQIEELLALAVGSGTGRRHLACQCVIDGLVRALRGAAGAEEEGLAEAICAASKEVVPALSGGAEGGWASLDVERRIGEIDGGMDTARGCVKPVRPVARALVGAAR